MTIWELLDAQINKNILEMVKHGFMNLPLSKVGNKKGRYKQINLTADESMDN